MTVTDEEYFRLIASSRVSPQTRTALIERLIADDPEYEPKTLTPHQLVTLRHLIRRLIPQEEPEIDLAAQLDSTLAEGRGDGWRYASLPSDAEAWGTGLGLLDEFSLGLGSASFDRLSPEAQDALLEAIASGRIHSARLDLKRWFEDVCASATQLYVAHPRTLSSMAYSGIADEPNGFVQLGIGMRESWEPKTR